MSPTHLSCLTQQRGNISNTINAEYASNIIQLPNNGLVIQGAPICPSLKGYDMGLGTSAFRLFRETVDLPAFDQCVKAAASACNPQDGKRSALRDRVSAAVGKFSISGTSQNRHAICDAFATIQNGFVELTRDSIGNLWLLIHSGYTALSNRISNEADDAHRMTDFARLQVLSAWSREIYASRLFALYYGSGRLAECCWGRLNFPYNSVDLNTQSICLGASKMARGRGYLFLAGQGRGALFINNTGRYECSGFVPMGLGHIKQLGDSSLRYQALESVLPDLNRHPHSQLRAIYHFN